MRHGSRFGFAASVMTVISMKVVDDVIESCVSKISDVSLVEFVTVNKF